ncbi:glycosyltransferase [Rhodomicrobium sp. Az07]|uniref:glycosyltransferase family protein n=1 Tax=Rhodomicrobium sp. Az07 TaxID=2839034 RepID=UPI001BEC46E0|nr:glycosyltransferase [Rhodomicrobium sp. Az07]MBT3069477.1 glycosyltransferase [Rhodomicrobium sp. Az07]
MKILFVMKTRGNAGSTHAVANYIRLAPGFGHTVAIFGSPIWYIPELKFSMDIEDFDRVVYLFETELYRIPPLQQAIMLGRFPRERRLIVDTDGLYNDLIQLDGYDHNHRSEADRQSWIAHMDALGDRVVQTLLHKPQFAKASALPFFGYDPSLEVDAAASPAKQWDVLHVGHNWWRWREVESELLPAFANIRDRVGRIGFLGLWWDAPPEEGPSVNPSDAFIADPYAFRRLRIETPPAVNYNDVIATMSTARINILTQRPLLRHLRHLTLKYFEVFCADTIPLLMLDDDHAEEVYGPAARELTLPGRAAEKILDALENEEKYRAIVADVRAHLRARHRYEARARELFEALDCGSAPPPSMTPERRT